jgi:ferredoxin
MACVGACPESALVDGVDQPLLKFIERNCVQCGLCVATCPEQAIALSPRLLLGAPAREARLLNETQPFRCVRCDKPFGTRQMVEAMLAQVAGPLAAQPSSAVESVEVALGGVVIAQAPERFWHLLRAELARRVPAAAPRKPAR